MKLQLFNSAIIDKDHSCHDIVDLLRTIGYEVETRRYDVVNIFTGINCKVYLIKSIEERMLNYIADTYNDKLAIYCPIEHSNIFISWLSCDNSLVSVLTHRTQHDAETNGWVLYDRSDCIGLFDFSLIKSLRSNSFYKI